MGYHHPSFAQSARPCLPQLCESEPASLAHFTAFPQCLVTATAAAGPPPAHLQPALTCLALRGASQVERAWLVVAMGSNIELQAGLKVFQSWFSLCLLM